MSAAFITVRGCLIFGDALYWKKKKRREGGGKTSRANWTWGETSRIRRNDPDSTGLLCYLMHGLSEDSSRHIGKNCLLLYLHRSYKK